MPITSTSMPDLENVSDNGNAFAAPPQAGSVGLDFPSANEGNASVHIIVGIAKEIGMSIGESIGVSANVAGNTQIRRCRPFPCELGGEV